MVDTWADLPTITAPSTSTTASPARASRLKGLSNDIPHSAFARINSASPSSPPLRFTIGDAVIVSAKAITRQEWLKTPDHVLRAAGGRPKKAGKGKGKARAKQQEEDQEDEGWQVNDGLGVGEKVAIIVGLYEDPKGEMLAKVRWFARPGAVWGSEGPEEGEEVQDFELYYTSDSTHLHETRALQSWTSSSLLPRPSTSVTDRTPLHTDSIPLATISTHASILTPSDPFPSNASSARRTGAMPSYLVRKVYDAKPVAGAEWVGEIDYLEVYRRGMSVGDWDVEAIMEEEEEEVISVAVKKGKGKGKEKEKERKKKAKAKASTSKGTPGKKGKNYAESEDGSSDDDDEDEETFNPHSDAESSDSEHSDASSSHSHATSSSKPHRTPTKPLKRKPTTQLTPSKSAKKKAATATPVKRVRPKLTAAAKSRAGNVEEKRRKYRKKREEGINSLPPPFAPSSTFLTLPPFSQAQALLHVSATPEFLPCREKQREEISGILGDGIISGSGTCLYIHGVPGTGKTATVHSVVRELQKDPDIPPFQFLEINGMKIAEPSTAFSILWEAVSGGKKAASPRVALGELERWFAEPRVGRGTTVVLVDELDQMITKKQDVVYNFFNWPHMPHSKLIVIAVANTMDLPERELSGKIRSRLGSNRLVFTPYKWDELSTIILSRLDQGGKGLKDKVFATKAVEVIAKKVAAGAGDARRALDVARRTVEKVSQLPPPTRLCTISDASATYREMTDYGSNAFLKGLSLQEKVLMLSLGQVVRRRGVGEVEVDEVLSYHLSFLSQTSLLTPPPSHTQLLSLLSSLHAQKLLTTDSQRGDYFQRVRLLVGVGELWEVLREDRELGGWVPRN